MRSGNDKTILVADFGRSGQGWLSYMLCYILNAKYIEPYCLLRGIIYSGSDYVLQLTQGNLRGRDKSPYSMVVKTHEYPDPFFSLTDKVILLARDPRDAAVSGYARHRVAQQTGTDVEKGAQKKTLIKPIHRHRTRLSELLRERLRGVKSIYFLTSLYRWKHFYEAWEHVDVSMKVTYEELSVQPKEALHKILAYLEVDVPDALIEEATAKLSFRAITGRSQGDEREQDVAFRKGIVGDYKNHFSNFDLKMARKICGRIGANWRYDL